MTKTTQTGDGWRTEINTVLSNAAQISDKISWDISNFFMLLQYFMYLFHDLSRNHYQCSKEGLLQNTGLDSILQRSLLDDSFKAYQLLCIPSASPIQKFYILVIYYLCILYVPCNKQNILPYTKLIDWFL